MENINNQEENQSQETSIWLYDNVENILEDVISNLVNDIKKQSRSNRERVIISKLREILEEEKLIGDKKL